MSDFQKQTVQWFPGHMAKTRRLIKESLKSVDAVTEVLDARIPLASRNPEIGDITAGKPRIILLNKCDVADEKVTAQWINYFKNNGCEAMAVDCRSGKGLNRYNDLIRKVLADKIQSNIDKGMPGKALRVMVVGIPNCGKSATYVFSITSTSLRSTMANCHSSASAISWIGRWMRRNWSALFMPGKTNRFTVATIRIISAFLIQDCPISRA